MVLETSHTGRRHHHCHSFCRGFTSGYLGHVVSDRLPLTGPPGLCRHLWVKLCAASFLLLSAADLLQHVTDSPSVGRGISPDLLEVLDGERNGSVFLQLISCLKTLAMTVPIC